MNEVILGSEARLSELAIEINTIKRQAAQTVLAASCEIGKRLTEAKNNLPHGRWTEWLQKNVAYSDRTAQQLMRCWDEYGRSTNPQALADFEWLTLTKAIVLLGVDPVQRSELIESGEVESLSTRELRKRVAELQEEKDRQQMRIEELEELTDTLTLPTDPSEEQAEELRKTQEERDIYMSQVIEDTATLENMRREKDVAEQRAKNAEQKVEEEKRKSATAEQKVEEAERHAAEAAEASKSVPTPEKVIEVVEVVPDEVRDELEQLKNRLRTAPNEQVIRIRDSYDRMLTEFRLILGALDEVEPEEAAKYRSAFRRGLNQMKERLE